DHVPQYLLVQGEVRDQLLQLPILFAELAGLAYFGRAEVPKLLLPAVIRLLAYLVLPAELGDGPAPLPLPEGRFHLLRRELARPHPRRAPVLVGDSEAALYASRRGSGKRVKTRSGSRTAVAFRLQAPTTPSSPSTSPPPSAPAATAVPEYHPKRDGSFQ